MTVGGNLPTPEEEDLQPEPDDDDKDEGERQAIHQPRGKRDRGVQANLLEDSSQTRQTDIFVYILNIVLLQLLVYLLLYFLLLLLFSVSLLTPDEDSLSKALV